MSDQSPDLVEFTQVSHEISKEEFAKKLNESEKKIIDALVKAAGQASEEDQLPTKLYAVGSVLTDGKNGQQPKDIDIVLATELKKTDFVSNNLDRANRSFIVTKGIAEEAMRLLPGLVIAGEIEPAIDEEHNNKNILKHQGSIILKMEGARPVELVNTNIKTGDNPIMKNKKFVNLEGFETTSPTRMHAEQNIA